MESPIKKLDFTGKENAPFDADVSAIAEEIEAQKPVAQSKTIDQIHAVASTIKPEEADEPLLRENPQRFVLFPIKYHEVSDAFSHA
jgi:ribonucleoside-diphosphate reductase subunit M2